MKVDVEEFSGGSAKILAGLINTWLAANPSVRIISIETFTPSGDRARIWFTR
ncbi:hypothetical protein [Roseateles sp.]|uniref:hypothetical protein n=1 Tax=Roseateles sp. TaxID=1971397 RepID=UPI0039E77BB1